MPTLHQYPYAAPKADAHCEVIERQANAMAFEQLAVACPAVRERRILPVLAVDPTRFTVEHRPVGLRLMSAVCAECPADPNPAMLPPLHIRRTGHFCAGQVCEPWTWSCRRCSIAATSRSQPGALAAALHHLATSDHAEPTNGGAQ